MFNGTINGFGLSMVFISLTACVSPQERFNTAVKNAGEKDNQLCMQKYQEIEHTLLPLKNKIRVIRQDTKPITLEMRSDESYVSEIEKQAIIKSSELSNYCDSLAQQTAIKFYDERYGNAFQIFSESYMENLSELYAGKITYGEFNRKSAVQSAEWDKLISNINEFYRKERQLQSEVNFNERMMLLNYGAKMLTPNLGPAMPAPRSPMQTQCNQMAGFFNCTSW
ncbi:hypothetical protein [Nitrosomonas sp. Nm34]|uniref:hypothetical protein n=1 Tax=Nitrosomonas sp. Nm34 TaxID=1881055 RepID=UPI0008EA9979|nr:hypothetical protein [Nitrosomonas sp. Nm34]SFJ10905.1 hypothetical protein SAMN05428978_11102 [Nitrosomonas sp. Nm34]